MKQTHFFMPRPEPMRPEVVTMINYAMVSRLEDNGAKQYSHYRRRKHAYGILGVGWNIATMVKIGVAILAGGLIVGKLLF